MLSCLISSQLFFFSLYIPIVHSVSCSWTVYGTPKAGDCQQALLEIPFAREAPRRSQALYPHIFAEPQFQEPPFREVINRYRPSSIIQLPKIWRYKGCPGTDRTSMQESCHVALMSQGRSSGSGVVNPMFTANWRDVIDKTVPLRDCLAFNWGGWTSFQLPIAISKRPVAVLYMYDSNSAFSIIMNSYMSDGTPVVPINDGTGLHVPGNATRNPLTLDFITNLTRTLPLTEYKLLDSK